MEVRTFSAFGRLLSATVFAGAMAAGVFGVVPTAIAQTGARVLEAAVVTRPIAAGETHTYDVPLQRGDLFSFAAEQKGIDIVVKVFAPGGTLLREVDDGTVEKGWVIADLAGTHKMSISALQTVGTGQYVLTSAVRVPEAADVSLWKTESELAKLEAQWDEAVRTYDVAMLDRLMSTDFRYFGQDRTARLANFAENQAQAKAVLCFARMSRLARECTSTARPHWGRVVRP
jgi:hypothetical protein